MAFTTRWEWSDTLNCWSCSQSLSRRTMFKIDKTRIEISAYKYFMFIQSTLCKVVVQRRSTFLETYLSSCIDPFNSSNRLNSNLKQSHRAYQSLALRSYSQRDNSSNWYFCLVIWILCSICINLIEVLSCGI